MEAGCSDVVPNSMSWMRPGSRLLPMVVGVEIMCDTTTAARRTDEGVGGAVCKHDGSSASKERDDAVQHGGGRAWAWSGRTAAMGVQHQGGSVAHRGGAKHDGCSKKDAQACKCPGEEQEEGWGGERRCEAPMWLAGFAWLQCLLVMLQAFVWVLKDGAQQHID